jgi:hypothetical protein
VTEPGAYGGPTALRIMLGAHLRRLREEAGISRSDAGWAIRGSESKISRLELGRVGFKVRDVDDLLTLYKLNDPVERDRLLELATQANNPGWWQRWDDLTPSWFHSYLGLEMAAELIRTFELQFVPGLLQTPDYARAVIRLGNEHARTEELDRRVALRIARQQVLERPNPPHFWAVVDEAALRRPIGGLKVMREQLEALIDTTRHPNVTLQVIPFSVGGHAAAGGAFTILRFPEADLSDVIYVEQLTSAIYLDKPDDVDYYTAAMERLCVEASTPEKTAGILELILQDLEPQT